METVSQQQPSQEQIFVRFEGYDFANDETFQSGLQSIVRNNQSKTEQEQKDAIQSAKYFYFTRFVQSFDLAQYKAWCADRSSMVGPSEVTSTQEGGSTDTIGETQAETVGNESIRQIPDNLAEGTPSEARLAPKLKPWEQKKAAIATSS
ncbi:hypothetical protein BGZ98_000220 [Dissophora globulifera]|nr:hypothetical protein BGZ98_000220 [Dissophora globulifera]